MTLTRLILPIALGLSLGACATNDLPYGEAAGIEVTELTELPAPAETVSRIGPGDPLQVDVTGDDTLDGTYIVDERGNVLFPYIGEVAAQGLTVTQFAALVRSQLAGDFIVDPAVTVTSVAAPPPTISIGGEIASPGTYPAAQGTTLLRALNSAGGLDEYANNEDVLVFRTVGDNRYIGAFNAEAIARGNYPDPAIYPGDVVMVGENVARRRFETILGFVPLFTNSLVLIDRISR